METRVSYVIVLTVMYLLIYGLSMKLLASTLNSLHYHLLHIVSQYLLNNSVEIRIQRGLNLGANVTGDADQRVDVLSRLLQFLVHPRGLARRVAAKLVIPPLHT